MYLLITGVLDCFPTPTAPDQRPPCNGVLLWRVIYLSLETAELVIWSVTYTLFCHVLPLAPPVPHVMSVFD